MSRRTGNHSRRYGDSGGGVFNSKSRSAPYLPILLFVLGALVIFGYIYRSSGGYGGIGAFSRIEGDFSCTVEVQRAIPVLKKAYGDGLHKVLHVGPDTCSVISKLRKEEETEAWGVEPYDIEDVNGHCRALLRKGIVRVADIKFPLPYRSKSFALVIVSDALDYLSPRYLNKTLPDLARVSTEGLVIFTGFPGQHRAKVAEVSKFGRAAKLRSSSWWARYFIQTSLEENESALKKFEHAAAKNSYDPGLKKISAARVERNGSNSPQIRIFSISSNPSLNGGHLIRRGFGGLRDAAGIVADNGEVVVGDKIKICRCSILSHALCHALLLHCEVF